MREKKSQKQSLRNTGKKKSYQNSRLNHTSHHQRSIRHSGMPSNSRVTPNRSLKRNKNSIERFEKINSREFYSRKPFSNQKSSHRTNMSSTGKMSQRK